ncbi:MAG: sensor histidine kinase [Pseudonocardiales bacterium]
MTREGGELASLLGRFGRWYAAGVRMVTLGPLAAVALLRASPEHFAATATVVIVTVVWSTIYVWWLLCRRSSRIVAIDAGVLLVVCLSVLWTDAIEQNNVAWIRLFVQFACVGYQWHTTPLVGGAATLVASGTLVGIMTAVGAGTDLLISAIWILVSAVLSRMAWLLMQRNAQVADGLAAEAERERRGQQVATAVRADERELANALHDTAATTLLMVGSGQVRQDADWLVPQARRDMDMLRTYGEQTPEHTDLVQRLRADIDAIHLPVEFEAPAQFLLPFSIARSVADAAREALNNVARHACATRVEVRLQGDSRQLCLDVVDDGRGFSIEDVPATRRGLRECVRGRLAGIGGTAEITSCTGGGTLVRLEWRA